MENFFVPLGLLSLIFAIFLFFNKNKKIESFLLFLQAMTVELLCMISVVFIQDVYLKLLIYFTLLNHLGYVIGCIKEKEFK